MIWNVIIIGSGPAGYSAGLYAARAGLEPLLFTGVQPGGQLTTTTSVENYLGLDDMDGFEMTEKFRAHAEKYGTKIVDATVCKIEPSNDEMFTVTTTDKNVFTTRTVILAMGASAKRLSLPSEEKLWNRGISACAVCDGALPMFRNKLVAVVGGGDTACEEALFLSRFASKVYLIHRGDTLRASKIMQLRVKQDKKIDILFNTVVSDARGEDTVNSLLLVKGTEETILPVNGLFYGIGHQPNTGFLQGTKIGESILDNHGYVITGVESPTATAIPGIFACGDVQDTRYRQAITAASSGCMAALDVNAYF